MTKATELVSKAIDIAKNGKTLYVMGCSDAPLTATNKKRRTTNHSYNKAATHMKVINAVSEGIFGLDCVCLIKGILWGRYGDRSRAYGGAKHAPNGVPDIGADQMITKCPGASTTDWVDMEPDEAVWTTGHIGVYISDGLVIEYTPKWENCVQITAAGSIDSRAGYNTRTQKKYGHIPYVEYFGKVDTSVAAPGKKPSTPVAGKEVKRTGVTTEFDKSLAGAHTVTARNGLNVRNAAGTDQGILVSIPKGTKVQNYGYCTPLGDVNRLYVRFTHQSVAYTRFCSAAYLKE